MEELVSVIIPTYNRERTIYKSVMSVVNQTYKNLEIIVYDDGSIDHTEDVVKKIKDKRIRYFKGENCGAGHARNMGIRYATGDYIAFHDSDDYCRPNRIESQLKFLKETDSDMVYAQLERHSFENPDRVFVYPEEGGIGTTIEETYRNFITRSSVWTQVIFCRTDCCKKVLFDETLPAMEDWEWSLRFAKQYKVNWKREIIVDSYISENSISRSSYNKMLTLKKMNDIYREDIDKYNIQKIWNWMIAYYIYNDCPETHASYGKATIALGIKEKNIKRIVIGIAYVLYIAPIRAVIKNIRNR